MLATGRNARERPAPPTPKSCSDQPKALWLAICANRIRVSLTYIVARRGGTLSRARHVSIGVRLIFCEIGVALCILKIAPNFLFACDNCDSLAPALEHPALAMLAAIVSGATQARSNEQCFPTDRRGADARRCVSLLAAAGLRELWRPGGTHRERRWIVASRRTKHLHRKPQR